MKHLIPFMMVLAISIQTNGQTAKYQSAMESKMAAVDTTTTFESWQELGNSFERIADAEKTQWLPYYYCALSNVMSGYMLNSGSTGTGSSTQTDQIADKAEAMITKAEALEKDNSDIYCIKKMIATLRMMADPMTRYQTYGPMAEEALSKAKSLDPQNPRVFLLEGQDKFYTPEQFGGSKSEAKTLFEESEKLFGSSKPKSTIDPHWGLKQVKFFLAQVK